MQSSDSTCPSSIAVDIKDCEGAGNTVGGILNNNKINEGTWTNKPSGCSFDPIIHFNKGEGSVSMNTLPICKKMEVSGDIMTWKDSCLDFRNDLS